MYAANSAAAATATGPVSGPRWYSYIATMPADHGRSRGQFSSWTPSSSASHVTGSRCGVAGDQVERRAVHGVQQPVGEDLHPGPQSLDVAAGERRRDEGPQPG